MPLTVAVECLSGCSGCEAAMLDMGTAFMDLLSEVDFVHLPLLMDHKYAETGEGKRAAVPEADLGIVSGGIRTREHLELAILMRKRCRTIVAMGTCAGHGGVPALANQYSSGEVVRAVCGEEWPAPCGESALLDRTYSLDEKIEVDFHLPGCPPHPDYIEMTFRAILEGGMPALPVKSVCDSCPVYREGKGLTKSIGRSTRSARYELGTPLGRMRCLLEQGFLCMGPVTRGGCGGASGETAPKCIAAGVPCGGCHGPIRHNGNPLVDMLNALMSNGVDVRGFPDRQGTLLRFTGAHGRLRKKAQGPGAPGRRT
ncbi:MAG: methyl viologen-reducing hydrogenase [Desulfobacteraceae bacterium]|nr:methyl viologen-reducing hydrogenase [Desulfobacteraceae bacterium]